MRMSVQFFRPPCMFFRLRFGGPTSILADQNAEIIYRRSRVSKAGLCDEWFRLCIPWPMDRARQRIWEDQREVYLPQQIRRCLFSKIFTIINTCRKNKVKSVTASQRQNAGDTRKPNTLSSPDTETLTSEVWSAKIQTGIFPTWKFWVFSGRPILPQTTDRRWR